jgi:hypothetical protein
LPAALLFHEKRIEADGGIIEIKIWRVPDPVPPSAHRFKYSLYYGRGGRRLVGFDNERGKGDHCHRGVDEFAYTFTTPERLIADFLAEVAQAETQG